MYVLKYEWIKADCTSVTGTPNSILGVWGWSLLWLSWATIRLLIAEIVSILYSV
jgi:hypothetical protein